MDLRNTNALMFKNSGTGAFNMIYRRDDGNIGWVEPSSNLAREPDERPSATGRLDYE